MAARRYLDKSPAASPFSLYLSTNGDGTGTKNMIGDYSITPEEAYITAPAHRVLKVDRLSVFIGDGAINADDYGGIIGGITNGVVVRLVNSSGVVEDLTDGVPITTSAHWGRLCHNIQILDWGGGNEYLSCSWEFNHGSPVMIHGDQTNSDAAVDGERLVVRLNDNFTDLLEHYFIAQGDVR